MLRALSFAISLSFSLTASAQWRIVSEHDARQSLPGSFPEDGKVIQVGDEMGDDQKFRWILADLEIPETIDDQPVAGRTVGLQFSGGDGGEIYVDRKLQGRYDNDHPLLAILSTNATPGQKIPVAVQTYGKVQGGGKFDEAKIVFLPDDRIGPVELVIDAKSTAGAVPDGLIGLSQGGGVSDYEDATAEKLKAGGFKWFRTDNVFTDAVKKNEQGELYYDWTSLDQRVDFIHKCGAEPILAVSYMPQVFDAVPDDNRQSAPNDYAAWEELCYEAAKRCLERGKRVAYWEVWNEANSGWIKPGPQDTGSEEFTKLYRKAVGKDDVDHEIVRRFEAYAKLYRATARGVRRADPNAKVGGPALASGPFESDVCPHCHHGKGFARGLMLWCVEQKLPLDFLSWHEYFHPADVIARQADGFREYLREFPALEKTADHLMISEWNEAWWPNRPQDHEIGAAWCADGMIRAIIPKRIDKPCFFYVKQGDMSFRGDWSMLMEQNRPKPAYNAARMFNSLSGQWLSVSGGDDDVCAVAAYGESPQKLSVIVVNHRFRFPTMRTVKLRIDNIPAALADGQWQEFLIDAEHSNIFTDASRCELEMAREGEIRGRSLSSEMPLLANSVLLLELRVKSQPH